MISTKKLCYKIVDKIASLATSVSTLSSDITTLTNRIKQSNWTQSDNTADDYIKNKPFYLTHENVYTETGVAVNVYQWDNIVFLSITAEKSSAIATGANVFTVTGGAANSIPKPTGGYATGAGFYSNTVLAAILAVSGTDNILTLRNAGSNTLAANAAVHVTVAYISDGGVR